MRRPSQHERDGDLPLTGPARALGRREFLRLAALGGGAVLLGACRGKPNASAEAPASLRSIVGMLEGEGARKGLDVFLGGQEFLSGAEQRIPFGLTREGFALEGGRARVWLGTDAGVAGPVNAVHQTYGKPDEAGPTGFFVARASVPAASLVDVLVELKHERGHLYGVTVFQPRARPSAPAPGERAIAARTPTTADPSGVAALCTRKPACPLHDKPLDQVLGTGKPVVFTISSPLLCTSRTCGPVLDEVLSLREVGAVTLVHAEPYAGRSAGTLSPTATAWRIESEPWTWVIDPEGIVHARFEGPVVAAEIAEALVSARHP